MMADEVFMQKSPLSSGGREPPCISVEDSSRSSVNYKPGLPDSRNCDSNGAKDPMKSPLSRKPAPARSPPARSPPARSPPARPPPTRSPPVRPPPSRSLPACSPSTLSPVQLDPAIASEDLEVGLVKYKNKQAGNKWFAGQNREISVVQRNWHCPTWILRAGLNLDLCLSILLCLPFTYYVIHIAYVFCLA